jgi:hypothetical protein
MTLADEHDKLGDECRELMKKFKTLILATVSSEGMPDASTTPYLLHDGSFFVLVSELAKHTHHLLQQQRCVALFLEDEANTVNVFARKRFTIDCVAEVVPRTAAESATLLDSMAERFGPVLGMLRQLPDFHLIRLRPTNCTYVRGFGQAFRFEASQHPAIWS